MSVEFKYRAIALNGNGGGYASFQSGFGSGSGSIANAWGWYHETGSADSYFYINGAGAWNSSANGIILGNFRLKTAVTSSAVTATVSPYAGTTYTGWTQGRSGSPSLTSYRKLIFSAPYTTPHFGIDWVIAREILSTEPLVSVGTEETL